MKISLIVATLGREKELYSLFESLILQEYKEFEVIIIDQNDDDRVEKCVKNFENNITIIYKRSNIKGIAYNRNIGLSIATGDIIGFTDDDCTYENTTLHNVIEDFDKNNVDIISYIIIDKEKNKMLASFPEKKININSNNMFSCAMSACIFIKVKDMKDIYFDNRLGVGSEFCSCEDSDLIYRLLKLDYKGIFLPRILIYHPCKEYPSLVGYNYGLGLGAFIKKTIVKYNSYDMLMFYFKELIKALIGILIRKNRRYYYLLTLKGRIEGFIKYK